MDLLRFQDGVCGVSLGAPATMVFRQLRADVRLLQGKECSFQDSDFSGRTFEVTLRPGDLYVLTGDSRYRWTHEIAGESVQGERFNITFRRLVKD